MQCEAPQEAIKSSKKLFIKSYYAHNIQGIKVKVECKSY
jgi:hypothetical protein